MNKKSVIKIGLSTSSVYPLGLEDTFRLAKELGYDGVEIMVTQNPETRDTRSLLKLSQKYDIEILSIHAPVLLLTHFVWGRDPEQKLWKTAYLAKSVNAKIVVVHPPFTWQSAYSTKFLQIVHDVEEETGIIVAVENMFSWKIKKREIQAYSPTWETIEQQSDSITIDFSHAALSGKNALHMVQQLNNKVKHIHLCDGSGQVDNEKDKIFDEHLLPGQGNQPVKETLQYLTNSHWEGYIVAEVNTRKAKTEIQRQELLSLTLDFARAYTT